MSKDGKAMAQQSAKAIGQCSAPADYSPHVGNMISGQQDGKGQP